MLPLVPLAVAAAVVYYAFASYRKFAQNLAQAKQSGIPYICIPIYVRPRRTQLAYTHN